MKPMPAGFVPTGRDYKRGKDGRFSSGMASEKNIHDAYDFHDPVTGMSAKVAGTRVASGGAIYVDINIHNARGEVCGEAVRTISANGLSVDHSRMETMPSHGAVQGQGFATRYNAQAEAVCRAAGVKQLTGVAGGTVGGLAWARAGWQFKHAPAREGVAARARAAKGKYDADTRAEIITVANNPRSTPAHYANIGHTPGATTWPGKEIMMGSTWEMVKPLA